MVLSALTNIVSSLVMNVATAPTWVIGLLVVGAAVFLMPSGGLPTGGSSGSSGSSGGDESGGGA